jgi:hypothetical protein
MPHVDPRPGASEFGPTFRPHLPPVIRGRDVVDVELPEQELMPVAVASGMERAEKGAQRPSPGRTAHGGPAPAATPSTPARRTAEPPAAEPPIEGQTQLPLTYRQVTLWSL